MLFALILAAATAVAPYRAPRTPDGRPDLQGEWTNATFTPLQRRKGFAGLIATEAEARAGVQEALDRQAGKTPPRKAGDPEPPPSVGDVESEWYEGAAEMLRLEGALRSSIIVEPADGRLPYNVVGLHMQADALRRDGEGMDGPKTASATSAACSPWAARSARPCWRRATTLITASCRRRRRSRSTPR